MTIFLHSSPFTLCNLIAQLIYIHIASFSSAENVNISMNQTELVFEEDPLELRCWANRPIDWCEFHLPGFQTNIKVFEGVQHARYEFTGAYQDGVCAIRIFSATADNHGLATCRVSYPGNNLIGEGACNVTVFHFPKDLYLSTNKRNFEFNEGDRMEFKCTAGAGGFPPPNINLFYDDKLVKSSNNNPSWSKIAEISDFDKKIACIVVHPYVTGQRLLYSRIITVNSSPRAVGKMLEDNVYVAKRNFTVGQNATLQVPISAYPKPELIEWSGASGERLDRERFRPHTKIFYKDTSNEWIFGLDILNVSDGDLSTPFRLIVTNERGLLDLIISTIKTDSTLDNEKIDITRIILFSCVPLILIFIVIFLNHYRGRGVTDYTSHRKAWVQALKRSFHTFEETSEHHPHYCSATSTGLI